MSVKNLKKENEITLDIDDDVKFDEIVDSIEDVIDDEDTEIIDAETDEIVNEPDDSEEIDDTSIIEVPDDDNNDGIEEPEDDTVTVNGEETDGELLTEEGEEEIDTSDIDDTPLEEDDEPSLDDINAEAGAEMIDEELEITDYADPEDIGEFFDMDKKEVKDELSDPEDIVDDVIDEEKPSGLMKEDVNDELSVDPTPRSIPSGLDKIKSKIMSISEEINSLTELTDDVETTSIIADLYNSAVALALDVEGAVDTYQELAEEAIEDEVEEAKDDSSK